MKNSLRELNRTIKLVAIILLAYYSVVIAYLFGNWALMSFLVILIVGYLFLIPEPKKKKNAQ